MNRKTIVIGHFGGKNLGDEAMLGGFINNYHRHIDERVLIFTKDGFLSNTDIMENRGIYWKKMSLISLISEITSSSKLVLCGGTHFHDDYTTKRLIRHYAYMVRITLITIIARLFSSKVYWISMGFGPCRLPSTKSLLNFTLLFVNRITVRDEASLDEISQLNKSRLKSKYAPDIAFGLAGTTVVDDEKTQGRAKILGISLMSLQEIGNPNLESVLTELTNCVEELYTSRSDISVHIFEIRGGNRESDKEVSKILFNRLRKIDTNRVRIVQYSDSPVQTLSEMSKCRWFLATRYHSAILAFISGCSLLIFPYHKKLLDLRKILGLAQNDYIDQNDRQETIMLKLNRLISSNEKSKYYTTISEVVEASKFHSTIVESGVI